MPFILQAFHSIVLVLIFASVIFPSWRSKRH